MEDTQLKQDILSAVRQTPLLSLNAMRLLELSARADHDLGDIVDVVKCDAALTAKVLRVVNSAAYGLMNPISTIDRAVAYLGERMIISIALGESAGKLLKKPMSGYEAQAGELWRHDLFTAIAAREVARHAKTEMSIDLAYTGGLLHDIGKAIISDFLNGSAQEFIGEIARGELNDYLDGERRLIGLDHAELGLELAKNWKLPPQLQDVIAFHHRPGEAPEESRVLVYAVHLGDIIAMMSGCATGSDGMQYSLDQGYQEYFNLGSGDLPKIVMAAQDEFRKANQSINHSQEEDSP